MYIVDCGIIIYAYGETRRKKLDYNHTFFHFLFCSRSCSQPRLHYFWIVRMQVNKKKKTYIKSPGSLCTIIFSFLFLLMQSFSYLFRVEVIFLFYFSLNIFFFYKNVIFKFTIFRYWNELKCNLCRRGNIHCTLYGSW